VVEAEIMPPEHEPRIHIAGARAPGWFGAVLALLTVAAAFSVGFMALFGRTLVAAVIATLVWPWLFSPEFTTWVFGAPHIVFWKILVLFLALDMIARLFLRRNLWPRR
jgi:hypothetical protein